MSVIFWLLGIVVAAGGVAAITFGIPLNEFTLGTTLIVAGTTALTGGLILVGLGAVVTELGRVAEALKTRAVARPAARPAEAAEPASPPAPSIIAASTPTMAASGRPSQEHLPVTPRTKPEAPVGRERRPAESYPESAPTAVDVSASAIERLRSGIPRAERPRVEPSIVADDDEAPLSPSGTADQAQQPRAAGSEPAPPEPKVTAEDRGGGAAVEALKASRLDFLFRSKPVRSAPQPERFDTVWPDPRAARSADAKPEPEVAAAERGTDDAAAAQVHPAESAPVEEPRTAAILKSGVVDGMAYTLYADGSIEAKLPQGTVRFGSIGELRAHIESNS